MFSSFLTRMSTLNLFASSESTTTTSSQSVPQTVQYRPPPGAETAFQHFKRDPSTFMRRNDVSVSGSMNTTQMDNFIFVSRGQRNIGGGRGAVRRSSITGDYQPLHTYKLMQKDMYDMVTPEHVKAHDSTFDVQMHNIHMDKAPKGVFADMSGINRTTTHLLAGQQQDMATNTMSACLLTRQGSEMSHIQPSGGDVATNTFATGDSLQQSVSHMDPQAQLFGIQDYGKDPSSNRMNVFVRKSRRGSVHIFGRTPFVTSRGGDGATKDSTFLHHYFPPPGVTGPDVEAKQRVQQHWNKKMEQNIFANSVKRDVIAKVKERAVFAGAGRYGQPQPIHGDVQDHEWGD